MVFNRKGNQENFEIRTVQKKKTTINLEGDGYASNYDHFSFNNRVETLIHDLQHDIQRIDAVHTHVKQGDESEEQKFARYKKEVSDHVPIVIELSLK